MMEMKSDFVTGMIIFRMDWNRWYTQMLRQIHSENYSASVK